jgi:hypothetical protein
MGCYESPVRRATLASPHKGMSVEPEVKFSPWSLIFRRVTGIGSIMYCGWSSSTIHKTFLRAVCAVAGTPRVARAAAPATPNRNVVLLILRCMSSLLSAERGPREKGWANRGHRCYTSPIYESCGGWGERGVKASGRCRAAKGQRCVQVLPLPSHTAISVNRARRRVGTLRG